MTTKSILKETSLTFLEQYLNNASPTGFEAEGQKIWMDYVKPYVDTFITDTYGTAVGVINPDAPYKVVIEGHADEIGSDDFNQKLSEKRASAVKGYLVQNGIADERLTSAGFGSKMPIDSNKSKAGKANNRRVEVKLVK